MESGAKGLSDGMVRRPRLWTSNFCAVAMGNFLLFFAFYLLLPVLPMYLADRFGADRSVAGTILASYTVMALMVRPLSGCLVDAFPRKRMLLICYLVFMLFFCGYLLAGTLMLFAVIRALHGAAFGLVTVSNSTMAIDVMPSERRGEGIGYYGVSNNLAMAIGPSLSLFLYETASGFNAIFMLSIAAAFIGLCCVSTVKAPVRETENAPLRLSLDRFVLLKGLPEMLAVMTFSFGYGILSTYLAVYGRDEIGISGGSGLFFIIMACGLVLSRLRAGKMLNRGLVAQSVVVGMVFCIVGYAIFVTILVPAGYYTAAFVFGLGYGIMCSAFQAMFINLAPHSRRGTANSSYFTSWDLGVGLGVFVGGHIAESMNYATAYRCALCVSAIGFVLFFWVIRRHFERNKLR